MKNLWKYMLCIMFLICSEQIFFACEKDSHNCSYIIENHDSCAHWKECECGNKTDIKEHSFDVVNQGERTLKTKMVCGVTSTQYFYACSCGVIGDTYIDLNDKKEYHVLSDGCECINCSINIAPCEHVEIAELFLEEKELDCPALFECDVCNIRYVKSLRYTDLKMPIVDIVGDVSLATKENKVQISFNYYGKEEILDKSGTIKWQGNSSIGYPKKNYTLKLDKKVELNSDWGKQKKYCLKANFSDFSQARNVVSGQIYSQIAKTRDLNDNISTLNNSGVVDGYPILVYQNGVYQGLYTLNIAKDKWMFGMKDSDGKNQAILQADDWGDASCLHSEITYDLKEGINLEYYSNEESADNSYNWVVDSFNTMIRFVNDNEGEDFKNGIINYVNVERAIDALIFTCVLGGADNVAKNILWVTFDGTTWLPSMYDMDSTWGLSWNNCGISSDQFSWHNVTTFGNTVYDKLYKNFKSEIEDRYKELRQGVLSDGSIENLFTDFFDKIPDIVYKTEIDKWNNTNSILNKDDYGKCQILYWAKDHLEFLDRSLEN